MQPEKTSAKVNPSTRALACIVEAALVAVPPDLVEAIVQKGLQSEEAVAWREAMGCDLISDKVRTALMQLFASREVASESLIKVRSPSSAM